MIRVSGHKTRLRVDRIKREGLITIYFWGWSKYFKELKEYMKKESQNKYLVFKLEKKIYVGKIRNGVETDFRRDPLRFSRSLSPPLSLSFKITLSSEEEKSLSYHHNPLDNKEWTIATSEFEGVAFEIKEEKINEIKNIGIAYLTLL